MVYNSEFCNESINHLENEMCFEEFAELSDRVFYYMDLKQAAEQDQESERKKKEAVSKVRGG